MPALNIILKKCRADVIWSGEGNKTLCIIHHIPPVREILNFDGVTATSPNLVEISGKIPKPKYSDLIYNYIRYVYMYILYIAFHKLYLAFHKYMYYR